LFNRLQPVGGVREATSEKRKQFAAAVRMQKRPSFIGFSTACSRWFAPPTENG